MDAGAVIHVGGGFGDLAYWTGQLSGAAMIYDLPFVNAAQARFLLARAARCGSPVNNLAPATKIALLRWAIDRITARAQLTSIN